MKKKEKTSCLLAFFIPIAIYTAILAVKSVVPFGENTLFTGDLASQYSLFLGELSDKLKSGGSFFYSFRTGMGQDYLCHAAYYLASPLNLLLLLFPKSGIALAVSVLCGLRIGLAGLAMSVYLKNHFPSSGRGIAVFSLCYALSSYSLGYYYHLMWMDCFALFPLIVLSLEKLYRREKPWLFSISLGAAILSNFYIGYMICIFCVFYYIYLFATDSSEKNVSYFFKKAASFAFYSLFAGALCAVFLIPEIGYLSATKAGDFHFYSGTEFYYSPFLSLFRMMADASPTYMHHPYLYSTVAAFFLLPLYFGNRSIPAKKRVGKGILCLILLLSFRLNLLDYLWNGFHVTNGFAGRHSFLFLFLVITMCCEAFYAICAGRESGHSSNGIFLFLQKYRSYICFLCFALLALYVYHLYPYKNTFRCILLNLFLILLYLILFRSQEKKWFPPALLCYIAAELFYVSLTSFAAGTDHCAWLSDAGADNRLISEIEDDSFYRIKNDTKIHSNEGAYLGYQSIPSYSSQSSLKVTNALHAMGFQTGLNEFNDASYEPVSASLLGIKYIISNRPYLESDVLSLEKSVDSGYLYQNRDVLPPAFLIPSGSLSHTLPDFCDPFTLMNCFAENVAGIKDIYTPIDLSAPVPSGCDVYVYGTDLLKGSVFHSSKGISEELYGNNLISILWSGDNNYIYHIASSSDGGSLTAEGKNLQKAVAYTRESSRYRALMDSLSESGMTVKTHSDSKITGTLNASYDGTVFTSIPYSEGWKVTVDGKSVPTAPVWDAFLSFEVEKGEHTIEMSYRTKGFLIGSLISISSILALAAMAYVNSGNSKKTSRHSKLSKSSSHKTC